jgi:gliding motility-associated-like protein
MIKHQSFPGLIKQIFSLLLFLGFVLTNGEAQTVTKTYSTGSSTSIDDVGNYGATLSGVSFSTSDFSTGCLISDVNVRIVWAKTDGSCTSPGSGYSYHGESSFRANAPSGTQVILATPGTWSGGVSTSTTNMLFNQGSGTPSGTPVNGTFGPNGGNLNSFNSQSPVGTWSLSAGDNAAEDPMCVWYYQVQVTAGIALSSTISAQTNVLCNGASTGSLSAVGSNGTAPYSYTWSNGATTATASSLAAGTYTVTVTDANNCPSSTSSATITQPSALSVSATTTQNVSCFGGSDGTASASGAGGNGGYSYLWSTGASGSTISGLVAGTYTVTATDGNGCTATNTTTVTQPAVLVASTALGSNVSCNGVSDGSAAASGTGGTTSYSYLWSSGATSAAISGLAAGTYTVTVTDANSCTDQESITITEPAALVASASETNVSCNGAGDGVATASVSGGTTAYSYSWNTGGTTASISSLAPGTYSVTVTDANSCTDSASTTITQPAGLVASLNVDSNEKCNGFADGGMTASATGGTTAYGFAWSNAATTASVNVAAGTYSVTITDANGCTDSASGTVTLLDTIPPTVLMQNVTVNLDANGSYTLVPAVVDSGSFDSCGVASYSLDITAFNCDDVGTPVTVTMTVTDLGGLISVDSSIVTVVDAVPPVALTQNISVNLDATGNASITASQINNGSYDSCGISSTTIDISTFNCGDVNSPVTVTLIVIDNNSNADTNTATVTVIDNIAPVVIPKNITAYLDSNGSVTIAGISLDSASWDTCGIDTFYLSQNTFGCGDTGANNVTLFADDIGSNTGSASAIIYIYDTIAPQIELAPANAFLDSTGQLNLTSTLIDNGSWDSCGIASLTVSPSFFDCGDVGDTFSIVVTATDISGNMSLDSTVIYVLDNIAPHVITQPLTIALDSFGFASITTTMVDNGSWDSCSIASYALDIDTFSCADVGNNTITLSVQDVNGNIGTAAATITVLDSISPAVFTQNTNVYLDSNGQYTLAPNEIDSGSWDSCGIATYSLDVSNFNCADVGSTVTVTMTITDVNSNNASGTALVTIFDTLAPTIITQSFTAYLDTTGNVSITTFDLDNGTWDSCGIDSIYLSHYDFNCDSAGINNVMFYARDVNSNLDSVSVAVTVLELIPPTVFAFQNTIVGLDSFGAASITATLIDSASIDSCGIDTMYLDIYDFSCGNVGANTVKLYVEDVSGNVDSALATVTIIDTIAPQVLPQNISVYLDSFGNASIVALDVDSGSWDSCGIASYVIDTAAFTCTNEGVPFDVILTITDVNGNTSFDTAVVTVEDTIAPKVITQNLILSLDSHGLVTITAAQVDNGSWDSCGIDSIYLAQYDYTCASVGVTTVSLFGTDIHGNTSSESFSLTVIDNIAPEVITRDIEISLNSSGTYTLDPTEVDSASWDSCGIATYSLDTSSFSCADTGTFTVTLTLVDNNGNVNTGTANVTLTDTTPPVVIPNTITVYLDATGQVSINTAMVDSASFDNCAIATMFIDSTNFNCSDTTSQTVILTVIDISGNVATAASTVNILDTIRPTMVTQNIVGYLNNSGEFIITPNDVDNGTDDNCAVDSLWLSDTLFDCDDTATIHTITLFAKDVSGNINSATATVQVSDTLAPIANAQNLTLFLDSLGTATIVASQIDSNSTDNCGIASTLINQTTFDCSNAGDTFSVLLFIEDISGNSAIDSSFIFVVDSTAPTVITQNITIALDSFGAAVIDTSMINNASWDACGIDTMYLGQYDFGCGDVGSNTVTLFVQDIHNNLDSASATVTVLDSIGPTIVLQNLTVYLDTSGAAIISADSLDNGSWDSCGIATTAINNTAFDCSDHGDTITIVFTATDVNGNASMDSAFVFVLDTLAPIIQANSDTVYLDTSGQYVLDYATLDAGTMDACSISAMYLSDSIFDCSNVDTVVNIWYIAIDSFGNSDSIQVGIRVEDTINPEILCPDSIVVNNDTGLCGAIVSFSWPSASDNCSIDTMTQIDTTGLDSGMIFPVGVTELSYVVFDQSGNTDTCSFTIEVIDTEAPTLLCMADTSICDSIFIYALPQVLDNCSGLDVNLISGIASGDPYPVGTTTNTFAVSDLYGNSDTCSFDVLRYDYPSQSIAGPNQELCEALGTTLDAEAPSVGTGVWSIINGAGTLGDETSNTSTITNLEIGTVSIMWTISNGVCPVEADTVEVDNLSNASLINAGLDQVICDTSSTTLGAGSTGIGSGTWTYGGSDVIISDSSIRQPIVSNLSLGNFSFYWTVENGVCPTGSDTVQVSVVPFPIVSISEDTYIFPTSSVELTATSDLATSYIWINPAGNTIGDAEDIIVSPSISSIYIVRGITDEGCSMDDSVYVGVNQALDMPTAFTPDNDGFNDVWNLKELANYPSCNVTVYNRWGNKMFESDGYNIPWDGTYKGEQLPSGAYFFVIKLDTDGIEPISGSITIIR